MKTRKSKGMAYFLLLFFGGLGFHKFYQDKVGMGILYLLTAGLLGLGLIWDLFTLGMQIDRFNDSVDRYNVSIFGLGGRR